MNGWIVAVGALVAYAILEITGSVPLRVRDLRTPTLRGLLKSLYIEGKDGAFLTIRILPLGADLRV